MLKLTAPHAPEIRHPINFLAKDFYQHKDSTYTWLREHAPVYQGKFGPVRVYFLSRYADCQALLKDPRFVRNRSNALGKGKFPFPVPKIIDLLAHNMMLEDEPNHRRLRNLVHQGFTPRALQQLEGRIESLTSELLEPMALALEQGQSVDLMAAYALPIPMTVISEMVGVSEAEMPVFHNSIRAVTQGFSGLSLARTLLWDMPATVKFARQLIARKRKDPQQDILSALIMAEDNGDQLSEDELLSMLFLLIMAGYETTVHLISNAVVTLLSHPEQLHLLQQQPELMGSAIEEVVRFRGPVEGTKMNYAKEAVSLHGVSIPQGAMVMPLLAAANRDPEVFQHPDHFDICRSPNKHLGFGQGIHYCLGAPLARLETRIALAKLFERFPALQLAVPEQHLQRQAMPLWHRYAALPVKLA